MVKWISLLFYDLGIFSYGLGIRLAALFNTKAQHWVSGRRKLFSQLVERIPTQGVDLWVHCASLGEFEQGRPILEAYRKAHPQSYILLTFFSPSGYEIRKNYDGADFVSYLPLDTATNAKKWVSLIQPQLTVFVKYEFWFNYIHQLQKNSHPLLLISGIFRPRQIFFQLYGVFFKKLLRGYQQLFIQDAFSGQLLSKVGIHNYTIVGDTRFDRVKRLSMEAKDFPEIANFLDGESCWIAGSTWPPDEEILKGSISKISKWIIAPHEIDEAHLLAIEKLYAHQTIRYSKLKGHSPSVKDRRVLIIDNIGMLASIYKLGHVAYIGGGFGKGIHNILEAAVYGIPVIFGPKYHKFDEAKELLKQGGGFSLSSSDELQQLIEKLSEETYYDSVAAEAKKFVESNLGATPKIMEYIQENRLFTKE